MHTKSEKKKVAHILLIILGCMIISMGYCVLMGTLGTFGGDSKYYVSQAREILTEGIIYYKENIATPYYWGYPTFLALMITVFGENWTLIGVIQILLSSASAVFLFWIIEDITEDSKVAVIMTFFYKLILDVSMWDGRILSDSLAMTLECMTLYFFYVAIINGKKQGYFLFTIFAFFFFATRTNALSLLVILFGVLFMKSPHRKRWIGGVL